METAELPAHAKPGDEVSWLPGSQKPIDLSSRANQFHLQNPPTPLRDRIASQVMRLFSISLLGTLAFAAMLVVVDSAFIFKTTIQLLQHPELEGWRFACGYAVGPWPDDMALCQGASASAGLRLIGRMFTIMAACAYAAWVMSRLLVKVFSA